MTEEQMRSEFEEWALSNEGPSVSVMRNEVGRYEDEELNMAWLGWQSAQSVPVVGDVLFFASESTETADSQIRYDVCADKKDYSFFPVVRKPTNAIPADELATLREKAAMADELRKDAERYRIALLPAQSKLNAASQPETHHIAKEYLIAEAREIIDAAIAQGRGE